MLPQMKVSCEEVHGAEGVVRGQDEEYIERGGGDWSLLLAPDTSPTLLPAMVRLFCLLISLSPPHFRSRIRDKMEQVHVEVRIKGKIYA